MRVFTTSPGTSTIEHANIAVAAQKNWIKGWYLLGSLRSRNCLDNSKVANLIAPLLPSPRTYGTMPEVIDHVSNLDFK